MKLVGPVDYPAVDAAQYFQEKRGAVNGNSINYTNVNTPADLKDGAGNNMQLTLTPIVNCYWEVHVSSIWHSPDAVWSSIRPSLTLSTTDLAGAIEKQAMVSVHSALEWCGIKNRAIWKLAAGTAYTCKWRALLSTNNNQYHYTGYPYLKMHGITYGHGSF